jgi:flagellin-like hook-associated protein FlgL
MRNARCFAATSLAMGFALSAAAAPQPFEKGQTQQATAIVAAVDPATRVVQLRAENGPLSFVAGPEVKNFGQIQVGDKVNVTYYQGLAAKVAKSNAPVVAHQESNSTSVADSGAKPSGKVVRNITTTVRIDSVDTSINTISFHRADGGARTIVVESPEAKKFIRALKPGDLVDVTYTESVAVAVVPAN